MTMPHLMNCPHTEEGWCADCVRQQGERVIDLELQLLALQGTAKPFIPAEDVDRSFRHFLKIERQFFDAIVAGAKTFEIRRNDRNFQPGQYVLLCEIDPQSPSADKTTGRIYRARIGHISNYAQVPGVVVFSLLEGALVGSIA